MNDTKYLIEIWWCPPVLHGFITDKSQKINFE